MSVQDVEQSRDVVFETAAEHLATRVPIASPSSSVAEIRRSLEGQRFDSAVSVAICDDGRLVGLITVEGLLAAAGDASAAEVMDPDPPVVTPGTDQEIAAWQAVRRGENTLAVVDERGGFAGLVPPASLLAVLLWEHEEDMARLGGFLHDSAAARAASEELVSRRLLHRLPWLVLGLVGALASAAIVGAFEQQLAENVILAFFIPGIVYMADAVGTQTETLIIRGLSVGIPIRNVVRRELLTGLLVGMALSLAFFPIALWLWNERDLAFAVSFSLFAASSTATLVAMVLPWFLTRLGKDPAFGSGPLATVIQDLLSILIYFATVSALVQ
jgi:magnesium transporter